MLVMVSMQTFFMNSDVLRLGHNLKILWIIIFFVVIDVMNDFAFFKRSPQHFFRDDAVLVTAH